MKGIPRFSAGVLGLALVAAPFAGAANSTAARPQSSSLSFDQALPGTPDQRQVDSLLKQVKANAYAVSHHAERLQSFASGAGRLHYTTHATELNGARDAINAMSADLRQLQELRPSALPWQQLAIDRLQPLVADMAASTTDAIVWLNENRRSTEAEPYRESLKTLRASADEARDMISVHLDYAKVRERLNRLDQGGAVAKAAAPATTVASSKPVKSLNQRLESELLKLPYYGVFDYLAFQVDGNEVTLLGDVSWPSLKQDAERAALRVKGVERVTNNIQVLPVSPQDDRLRLATYWAVYGHSSLARYRLDPNPPIRIIVENGHVTLKGSVDTEMERNLANLQARSVPGTFSVTNDLQLGS